MKRLGHECGCPQFKYDFLLNDNTARHEDDRGVVVVIFKYPQQFKAVHAIHIDITQYEVNKSKIVLSQKVFCTTECDHTEFVKNQDFFQRMA